MQVILFDLLLNLLKLYYFSSFLLDSTFFVTIQCSFSKRNKLIKKAQIVELNAQAFFKIKLLIPNVRQSLTTHCPDKANQKESKKK